MVTAVLNATQDFMKHPLRQLAGFLTCLMCLYLAICLITFNTSDPSLNRATLDEVQNAGGYFGALLADIALQTLGLAVWCFVFVPFTWGVKMAMGKRVSFLWLRVTLLLTATVLFSTLLSLIEPYESWPILSGLGGTIGLLVEQSAKGLYSHVLFIIAATATFLFMLALSFGMSTKEWKKTGGRTVFCAHMICQAARYPYDLIQARRNGVNIEEYEPDEDEDDDEDDEYERDPWCVRVRDAISERLFFWRTSNEWEEEDDDEEEYEESDEDEDEEEVAPKPRKKSAPRKTAVKAPLLEMEKAQSSLDLPKGDFQLPPLSLLAAPPKSKRKLADESALLQNAKLLEQVLQEFGVQGEMIEVRPGPVVTLYELEPAPGTKSSRVIGLADDVARSMSAVSARIAVIPGRNAIGVELPNTNRETVYFRQMLESKAFEESEAKLPMALGKDIGGEPIIVDLAKMPHLLVAGTTGSGKSVAVNTMIMSLLYRLTPDEVKFIMIDPKMLELSVYDGIPHLLSPVVTEPGKAVVALKWTTKEMENRYRLMSNLGVRNIDGYNKRIREARAKGTQLTREVQTGFDVETGKPIMEEVPLDMVELPFIVVVVDEMADLMLVAGKDIESSIQRLAQMARAAGIHIIMATQRPSVDVITGVIKANFPTRISFQVTSRIDSRTILGEQGAEQLLGQGDMLYMAGGGRITRVHGPFVSDKEVEDAVAHLKTQGEPTYVDDVTKDDSEMEMDGGGEGRDELYMQAKTIIIREQKASTSYIQRVLKIGYNRAATIIEQLEKDGIVSPASGTGKREVLVD
jgi:S-DNA-T family DNA segregation ATPase FtsK/SpoIIIE